MPTFQYTALSGTGQRVRGSLAAANEQAVLAELESKQLTPVAIREKEAETAGSVRSVSARSLGESYEQLGDLLRAGVPLLRSLKLLGARKSSARLSGVYRGLAAAVEKGSDLAAAMAEEPRVFAPVHIAMVRAGEKGGFLEDVLVKLGRMVVKQAEMRAKIIGNLVYPAVLVGLGLIIGGVIFGVFVPKFQPMFEKLGDGLPWVTKMVFAVSGAITRYGPATAIVLAIVGAGVWRVLRLPKVREWLDRLWLKTPVIGPILRNIATVRLCQLMGAMLGNGVPMLAALQISRDGTGSGPMRAAVDSAIEAVRSGQALATPLAQSGLLDDDVSEMIAVGESANNLDDVLLKVAETIEARLDRLLGVAVRLIEPLLLVGLASVVGIVAAALLLPMSKLSGAV